MPIYKAKAFRRRYRMFRELFLIILNGVTDYDDYFEDKYDCTGKINKNDKNFKFQNPLTCMYLTQLTFMENLKNDIFCKKRLFRIKTALTFAYVLEKNV
jgi:hypothetical protein